MKTFSATTNQSLLSLDRYTCCNTENVPWGFGNGSFPYTDTESHFARVSQWEGEKEECTLRIGRSRVERQSVFSALKNAFHRLKHTD